MNNKLELLVVHCSDTPLNMDVTPKMIRDWHMNPKAKGGRGWDRCGYADLIRISGEIANLTPYNDDDIVQANEVTWGAVGVNRKARHVCIVGGGKDCEFGVDWMSEMEFMSLNAYIREFINKYPNAKVAGHYHFSSKTCPHFNIEEFFDLNGIPKKYIYETLK